MLMKLPSIGNYSLIKPVKQIISKKIDEKIRSYTETVPITEFSPEDIFIVGYPKSGNSWFQNIISGIAYGVNPDQAPDSLIQDLIPDVHYKRYYRRYGAPMFFKSHHLPMPDYRRVIYLIRDGRDVMVSYFHFVQTLHARKGVEVNMLEMISEGKWLFHNRKWHEHVEKWLSNPHNAEMLIVRYEDLLKNPAQEFKKVCEFANLEASEEFLEEIGQRTSFDRMRRKEAKFGLNNTAWPKDKFFNRRGKAGSYKDEMPPAALEEFLKEAGDTLKKLEYVL